MLLGQSAGDSVHKYPSSSHYHHNWDALEAQMKAEEKDEKLEGDAALNKLFQQIYADGNDETRRAMNKSFVSIVLPMKNIRQRVESFQSGNNV